MSIMMGDDERFQPKKRHLSLKTDASKEYAIQKNEKFHFCVHVFQILDGLIRANLRVDSRESMILANRFRVPELNPFFANRASGGGGGNANRRFEAIRANRSNIIKIAFK